MELIPSIDLRHGKVVRLERGRRDRETVYFDDPVDVLRRFQDAGASWVHIVDLDAAFGEPRQRSALARIVSACRGEELEQGGGLRSAEDVADALDGGFDRVVLGSLPAREPDLFADLAHRFPGRLVPAWEVENGELRVGGWESSTPLHRKPLSAVLNHLAEQLPAVLVTDISRDGMLCGANVELAVEVARAAGIPAIVSGGVAALADVERAAAHPEVAGLIVGKAYYEGAFDLASGLEIARRHSVEVTA
jgi:phosphoribosylformimino-5-aminoimidazole carboxamide ribotide isomerase